MKILDLSASPSKIYRGQSVRVSLEAMNAGNIPAEVTVGKKGEKILRDYCTDMFENSGEGFSSSTSTTTEEKKKYDLKPGERMNVRWLLQQQGDVPLYGKRCGLEFSIPFDYSVQAFRQVQIKRSAEVEGSEKLSSESSAGPMLLSMRTLPGATGKTSTFIATEDGDRYISLVVELINKEPEEEYTKGLIDVEEKSLYIEGSGPLKFREEFDKVGSKVSEQTCGGCEAGKICARAQVDTRTTYRCVGNSVKWVSKVDKIGSSSGSSSSQGCSKCGSGERCVYDRRTKRYTCVSDGSDSGSSGSEVELEPPYCSVPSSELKLSKGRSLAIRCRIPVPDKINAPSVLSELEAGVNYTYVKDAGERTVRVEPRG
ncbi:MAG: hypothetical protein ABEJ56_05860 [Candidatus Nanohaloarchaea archaeon]